MTPKNPTLKLDKMAQNERVDLFLEQFNEPLAIKKETQYIHVYHTNIWNLIDDYDLSDMVIHFFERNGATYSAKSIDSLILTLKKKLPKMGNPSYEYIAFKNGLVNRTSKQFEVHDPEHWITSIIPHNYSPCHNDTPNFDKWISSVSDNNSEKEKRILSAFYMILTNRYNWQMFIEITGKGGTGKSIFTYIASLLAGKDNTISISLSALENENVRDGLVNKMLIIANDQSKFVGDGATLRAITGGDPIFINPKYQRPFNATIQAVFIMANNHAASFTENNGGIARRRILFRFDNEIPFEKRDEYLSKKLESEISGIVGKILNTFLEPNEARKNLELQRQSDEAQLIKSELDPLYSFAKSLYTITTTDGLYMGSKKTRSSGIFQSLYPLFLKYCELNNYDPDTCSQDFGIRLKHILAEQGNIYPLSSRHKNNKMITNVLILKDSELDSIIQSIR